MSNGLYSVGGRIEVGIQFNGQYFPLDVMNVLHFLQIGWTTRTKVPTCHFAVSDVQHSLDQLSLQDGIPITITIKPYGQQTRVYTFRKFNHHKKFNGQCFQYEVDGYLDNPMYWSGTTTAALTGTSDYVLSQIASACGLKYSGTPTSDSQLWIPRNRTYGEWVSSITERGYAGPESYMVSGIDPQTNTLLYRDVNNLPDPQTNMVFGQLVEGSLTCTNYAPITTSGMTNKFQGYQHTRYDQSAVSQQSNQALDQLKVTPDVSGYYWNKAVRDKMGQGYRSFGAVDVGNVHSNYEQALYQNRRQAALYSLGVEFLLLTPSDLTIFDRFTFSVDTDNQKQDVPYAGTYTVAAKALFIQGATYAEKILGTRQGTMGPYVSA